MSLVQNFNSSSFRNYFSAFLTELIIMVMSVLLYRFCLLRFGEDDFSIYSIYRRGFSFLQPLLMIGLGVGIPRFISLHFRDKKRIAGYYSAATIIILMICAISSVLLFIFSRHISAFVFGAEFYEYLIPPLILMLIGVLVYNISYSYYRGILNMKLANLFQFLFLGIIPVVSVKLYEL